MTTCDRLRADAPGLAALRPDDPERIAAIEHASGCPACARALAEAGRLQALIAHYEAPPLPAGALQRAAREIRPRLRRDARRRLAGSVVALTASAVVFVAFARSRSPSVSDWALAAGLLLVAVLLVASASRRPRLATALAGLAVVAAATISGTPGPLAVGVGLECLATEVAAGGLTVAAVWLALRGGTTSPAASTIVATGAAGAVAGAAALQITCAAHTALPHVLVFHVGGLVIAAVGAGLLWRIRSARLRDATA